MSEAFLPGSSSPTGNTEVFFYLSTSCMCEHITVPRKLTHAYEDNLDMSRVSYNVISHLIRHRKTLLDQPIKTREKNEGGGGIAVGQMQKVE
jgi:hypothetical protein